LFVALIFVVCLGAAFAEIDSTSCDVAGLSSLASSSCSDNCETQSECSNAVSLLINEAERCGCDSECQQVMDESRLISAKCESQLEDEDDDEEEDDQDQDLDLDELSKTKKKSKKKSGKKKKGKKGKKKGKKANKKNKKLKKMWKKWQKKVKQCKAIVKARKGSKSACVSCCVKNIVLYAVSEEFDLASVPEDVRRQREQVYEEIMNQNIENKMLELVSSGVVEESNDDDLAELEEDLLFEDELEEDEDDEEEDEEDEDDLEEEDEELDTEDSEEIEKKKKKKKKGKKKGKKGKKNKKKKKKTKKMKKNAKKACKKQVGMVFAFDLSSTSEPLTIDQAKQNLAVQSLDFDELEEPVEEEEEEEEEEELKVDGELDLDLDLDEIEKKSKVSKKKAKKAAKKCCPKRVSMSSFEHQYVKQF